jgi:hypothetical protein
VPAHSRVNLERWRAQLKQWIADASSPIREVELIQPRLDIDAQLAQIDQAARLPELEAAFVKVAASWAKRSGTSAAALREVGVPASAQAGWTAVKPRQRRTSARPDTECHTRL